MSYKLLRARRKDESNFCASVLENQDLRQTITESKI